MESNTVRPKIDPQAEIAQLRAENSAQRELIAELNGTIENLSDSLVKAQIVTEKAMSYLSGNQIEPTPIETVHTAKGRDNVVANDGDKAPSWLQEQKTKLAERFTSRRLAAAAAIGLTAVASIFALSEINKGVSVSSARAAAPAQKLAGASSNPSKALSAKNVQAASVTSKESRRDKMLNSAQSATTVAEAVKDLHGNPSNVKENIRAIFNQPAHQLDHITTNDAMSSLLSKFNKVNSSQAAEGVAYSIKGSPAYAALAYNQLFGTANSKTLPEGVTNQQAVKALENAMTAKDTTFAIEQPSGTFINHGQHGETVYDAGTITLNGDKDVFVMTPANGKQLIVKDFQGHLCENILTREQVTIGQFHSNGQRVTVNLPSAPAPHTPGTIQTPNQPQQPSQPKTPNQPQQPSQPKTPNQPQQPNQPQTPNTPPPTLPPKNDPNTTPAGVPGVPGSSGGNGVEPSQPVPGNAPAGVEQPQLPTPAPVTPAGNETPPTGPAVTGTDPGTTGPAPQGNPGTTTPAGNIDPSNTPVGQ